MKRNEELVAKQIRQKHVAHYRELVATGKATSPIRDLAIMMGRVETDLNKEKLDVKKYLVKLTIGDIDPRNFHVDGPKDLASELGLDPRGNIRKKINQEIQSLRETAWKENAEPKTGYQYEAVGWHQLRNDFCTFLNQYGFSFVQEDAVIHGGGLPGIHAVLETIASTITKKTFIAPVPGFSVFYTQAKRLGFEFVSVQTHPQTSYCLTESDLKKHIVKTGGVVLYLTPMNNPSSSVYDPDVLKKVLKTFVYLYPHGYIIMDLAYLEMIDQKKAQTIMSLFLEPTILKQTIMMVSMSKMFGYPRLRSACLLTKNEWFRAKLMANSQVVYASLSGAMELEAHAVWRKVKKTTRQKMFTLFRQRQTRLIELLMHHEQMREKQGSNQQVVKGNIHREVPLYVYIQLAKGVDPLDFFVETGICGVPGIVFGDDPNNNMIRFSVGIEPMIK